MESDQVRGTVLAGALLMSLTGGSSDSSSRCCLLLETPQCQQLSLSGRTEGESSSNVTLKTDVSYTCSRSQWVTQHREGSVCSLPVTGLTHRVSNQHTAQTELSLPSLHTADSPAAFALEGDAEGL